MAFTPGQTQENEAAKIRHRIIPYTRGASLDIGCGPFKPWPNLIGIDHATLDGNGNPWKADLTRQATDLGIFADDSLEAVFSSFLLDRLDDPEAALAAWWRVIKRDGHLVLYLPHADHFPHVGKCDHDPAHQHDWFPEDIIAAMENIGGWDLVENEVRTRDKEYSFFQVYRKGKGNHHAHSWKEKAAIAKPRCIIARYGGIGDLIMAASVFPLVKEQGFHLTLNCHPNGPDIVGADPHIDAFIVQDPNQVPNHQLADYWMALEKEYDRAINLHESVEGTALAFPGRRTHAMTKDARHMMFNVNYLDLTHAIAGVPLSPKRPRFYARPKEEADAITFRKKLGDVPVLLWSLAGSSVHKFWPWLMEASLYLMTKTDCKIVFVGDQTCQLLEMAICQKLLEHYCGIKPEVSNEMKLSAVLMKLKEQWGENRIICKSGAWHIRETLAFIDHVDVVVGTETGVLNAAGMKSVPKVVFLSHSSPENLTRDWVNATVLEPVNTPCYPCHRLHYSRDLCPEYPDESAGGASLCAGSITWQRVVSAIVGHLNERAAA